MTTTTTIKSSGRAGAILIACFFAGILLASALSWLFVEDHTLACRADEVAVRVIDPGPPAHTGPQVCVSTRELRR